MHEQDKIEEAAFFLDEMAQRDDRPVIYRYLTSAFLSAARSVLQYARDEAGQGWYDSHITSRPLLGYFRDKRDANVHDEPVVPAQSMTTRRGWRPWASSDDDEENFLPPTIEFETVTYRYRFDDWPGPEDVLTLCRQYLDELRAVVADGQARGFLTLTP